MNLATFLQMRYNVFASLRNFCVDKEYSHA